MTSWHLLLRFGRLPACLAACIPNHLPPAACLQDASVDDKLEVMEHLVLHATAPWLSACIFKLHVACCLPSGRVRQ